MSGRFTTGIGEMEGGLHGIGEKFGWRTWSEMGTRSKRGRSGNGYKEFDLGMWILDTKMDVKWLGCMGVSFYRCNC